MPQVTPSATEPTPYIVQAHISRLAQNLRAICPVCGYVLMQFKSGSGEVLLPCLRCDSDVAVNLDLN